ncbi:unnamed protein product [Leptosia nina]|uniref:Uncharacterized protein n=1 Tax=Leptosia nina TaxID=320188 RepID=A0AAV1JS98_9NEOP
MMTKLLRALIEMPNAVVSFIFASKTRPQLLLKDYDNLHRVGDLWAAISDRQRSMKELGHCDLSTAHRKVRSKI